jgi:hypothetical protein
MKKVSLAAAMVLCTGLAVAFQPEAPTAPTTPTPPAPVDAHAPAVPLLAEHIELNTKLVGEWTTVTRFWMAPGQEPMESHGKAKFEPIMGAKFVRQTFTGEMMGTKFNGEGLFGFNAASREFETTWIDNQTTGIMLTKGTKNAKGEIESTGEVDNPETGATETIRTVLRFDSKTQMTYEMWFKGSDGGEFKALEVVYTKGTASPAPAAPSTGK